MTLDELYGKIPGFNRRDCNGCHDCCGPHPWAREEHDRITAWLQERNRIPEYAEGIECPYIGEAGCTIYEVRPFLCRLYGMVRGMRCPHGLRPQEFLGSVEARRCMTAYEQIMRLS